MKKEKCSKQSSETVNKGFTLIELLVVVLIIGILAAIALPQYKANVERTKASSLFSLLKTIAAAEDRYYLTNNTYTKSFNSLDIEIPVSEALKVSFQFKPSYYYLASGTNYVQIDVYIDGYGRRAFCYAKKDSSVAEKVCKGLGVNSFTDSHCAMIGNSVVACKGGQINI